MSVFEKGAAAFYGLGAMGLPIATRLAGVLPGLAVVDANPERAAAVAADVPSVSADAERAEAAEVAFLCLPSPDVTRQVVQRLVEGGCRLVIDFGAEPPDIAAEFADTCAAAGAVYCDVPVFGSPVMAARGDLYFLFSGPQDIAADFAGLAEAAGFRMRNAGPTGAASTIKILQNALGTANLAAAAEALRVCEAAEIGTETFINVVKECNGIGISSVFERYASDMAARHDSGDGRLRIAAKDSAAAAKLADRHGVNTPVLTTAADRYRKAAEAGMADQQFTQVIDAD